MSHEIAVHESYLDLPLQGLHLIEASAGTGKTFALATLVTRLLVERGWRIGQILAVTFTEAATQELRKRIRDRLLLAARLVEAAPMPEESAEAGLTRALIQRYLALGEESPQALRRRLQAAADEIDLAAIFTIHGFCARVLREHALESGQAFDPPTLIGSERELHDELAADLWRSFAANEESAQHLPVLWSAGPEALAQDLPLLIRQIPLLPPPPKVDEVDPRPALQQAAMQLGVVIDESLDDARALIAAAFERKVFDGRRARAASFDKAFQALRDGRDSGLWSREDGAHLDKLEPERLLGFCKAGVEEQRPRSPLFDAVLAWREADDRVRQWQAQQRIGFLHQLREAARLRLQQLKQVRRLQSYDDLIEGVAVALEGPHGALLSRRLREQYRVALVDEFQDTDERQWSIFQRVFGGGDQDAGEAPALFLIGDPKQAIYGFRGGDVQTYLRAAAVAEPAPALSHNFRSRPSLLRALEALYTQAGDDAFLDQEIRFHAVQPGGKRSDTDYLRDGLPAPALTVRLLPDAADGKPYNAEPSRKLAADACVAAIHAVLSDARAGRASLDGRPVRPGDIAVLVRKHHEATRIQRALAAVGISAVAAGKQSLFATEEAQDLLALFAALLQPADEGRLRAALATVLLGLDAAAIDALEHDGERRRLHQLEAMQWRERWARSGPFALISDLCAVHAERLLGLLDGERRLTNTLQLGELLQQADARALGLHGLVDWLRTRIVEADANDEQQLLRLESDAQRVQIVTLHKSKGLEYPLVFLPFVGIGGKPYAPERRCVVHEGQERALHWKIDKEAPDWKLAAAAAGREQEAEDARLLYVGLTRAEHALWIATGSFYQARTTRLAPMLADLPALAIEPGVDIDATELPARLIPLPAEAEQAVPPARQVLRSVPRDWWVYSFTQLAHADGGSDAETAVAAEERGADDEPASPEASAVADAGVAEVFDPRFSGSRFGNVLHDALEHSDFSAWQDWHAGNAVGDGETTPLFEALRAGGYADADLEDGVAVLVPLVGQTLTVTLPEGARLCEVPSSSRRAEIEFHFALQPTSVEALLAVLHAHGVVPERRGFGLRRRLEGLMTGKIDLTYTVDGRWYVLDYKSNRLPAYERADLDKAMAHSEYDLQALIYTLALHRWLRFRLGSRYDYARDFGGIRYLFCRGLDAARSDSPGIHTRVYSTELVDELDRLFAGGDAGQAALIARAGDAA